jgi:hypothetical protein
VRRVYSLGEVWLISEISVGYKSNHSHVHISCKKNLRHHGTLWDGRSVEDLRRTGRERTDILFI